ncbi:MAG TPA: hypothetical protein VFH78_02755 [Candidatus Thermoplasmatota archaeon]|nr:hypothetical protein [Candidatus Thermoplasmatota archaeon]
MRAAWLLASVFLLAMAPLPASGAPAVGTDSTCGTGAPVTATHGAGDPALPSLVYAALKTGFRVVVAWETDAPEVGRLRYALDGGATTTVSETVPRTSHVFVIDGLPLHRSFCFTPLHADGSPAASQHAIKTRNAMNAHDGTGYTMNLLVLANEQSALAQVEFGLDDYAELLYDSTDGHVRPGRHIILFGDLEHHNAGWVACYLVTAPGCTQWYDVIFTNDAAPQGAASTYLDGIQNRRAAIWMNWYWQAGLVNLGDEVGNVLMHEVGHYAFGMLDLYGGSLNCWDAQKGLSIMGASRSATEFDDEINRCPDEPTISNYAPSYPRLRARFPLVPDRQGVIDEGPFGVGPQYARHTFEVTPALSELGRLPPLPRVAQDDAGSGEDAGSFPQSAVPIEAGRLYEGTLLTPVDGADVYRLEVPAGSLVEIAVYPAGIGCPRAIDESYRDLGGACANRGAVATRTLEAPGGELFVRFATGTSVSYRFGVGVDAPAPGPV